MICPIQYFEANFLWEASLKILNSGIEMATETIGKFYEICLLLEG